MKGFRDQRERDVRLSDSRSPDPVPPYAPSSALRIGFLYELREGVAHDLWVLGVFPGNELRLLQANGKIFSRYRRKRDSKPAKC